MPIANGSAKIPGCRPPAAASGVAAIRQINLLDALRQTQLRPDPDATTAGSQHRFTK